jgi:hypothetical protein
LIYIVLVFILSVIVFLSLRPYIGHANDRHINPGLYGVFALPQQSTLHVRTDPLLGQQIEFLVFRIKTQ